MLTGVIGYKQSIRTKNIIHSEQKQLNETKENSTLTTGIFYTKHE